MWQNSFLISEIKIKGWVDMMTEIVVNHTYKRKQQCILSLGFFILFKSSEDHIRFTAYSSSYILYLFENKKYVFMVHEIFTASGFSGMSYNVHIYLQL